MSRTLDLDHIFTYHTPSKDQVEQYSQLRTGARLFAQIIVANTPAGPDQSAAIRKVREAVMTANASIALNGRIHHSETPPDPFAPGREV